MTAEEPSMPFAVRRLAARLIEWMLYALKSVGRITVWSVYQATGLLQLWRHNLLYRASADDIFVVTYPKSGTTWMQQIVLQLLNHGGMTFEHINHVSPHLEPMLGAGRVVSDLPAPRVIKSHLHYAWVPKGPGRYIYVIRDAKDVALSYFYHHQKGRGYSLPFRTFFESFLTGKVIGGSWFTHVKGWLANKNGLNVLVVHYEDMISNLEGEIRRVARFCNLPIVEAELSDILLHCSFAFMQAHESKFSPDGAVPKHVENTGFIRMGHVGDGLRHIEGAALSVYNEQLRAHFGPSVLSENGTPSPWTRCRRYRCAGERTRVAAPGVSVFSHD
jgi:hypothetical protein